MLHIPASDLKKTLVASGFVDPARFDKSLAEATNTDRDITDVLVEHGDISEDYLAEILAQYFNVPFVTLGKIQIPKEVTALISEEVAKNRRVIPFELTPDRVLKIGMEDPGDLDTLDFLEKETNLTIAPHIITASDFRSTLGIYKQSITADFTKIIEENVAKSKAQGKDVEQMAKDLPVINILNTIMEYAISERASDIHLERLPANFLVRFRVDGILHDIVTLPVGIHPAIVARVKILADLKIDEQRLPQDGRFRHESEGYSTAVRVSVVPAFYGEKVVMRLLEESERFLTLEELGLSQANLELVDVAIREPHGMILSTGPTGSGKTTTLYTILHVLNRPEVNISTVEDPIEYDMKRINQIQVNPKINLNFVDGLRSLLRQDPDILMVGEIRDKETADMAIHASLTGHLLLSTLHTNDAPGTIPRLIDLGAETFLVASTVNLVIAQRLVRKICTSCVTSVKMTPDQMRQLEDMVKGISSHIKIPTKTYKGKGCKECNGSGLKGRVGIFEVMEITPKMRGLISAKASEDKIREQALVDGMITMLADGFSKVEAGTTTLEEVLRVTKE